MLDETKIAIISHATREFPREACGLILNVKGGERYFPCRNMSQDDDNFILNPMDYAAAEEVGHIIAVVHSHPNAAPTPSQSDRVACEASGLPWHILGYPSMQWAQLQPQGYKAPLLGREFSHGVLDCYTLIRDWYAELMGIALPDFPRSDEWWRKGGNLYLDHYIEAGFIRVTDAPRRSDVFLMQVLSTVPNHGAVYLGDNVIMHHLMNRLSAREVYGGYYQKHTTHLLRHKDLL